MAEEQTAQDSSVRGPSAEQPFTVEASQLISEIEDNSKPTADTQVKRHSSLSEGPNNKSSQISDTESMDRGNEEFDDDVVPDAIPSNKFGSAFATVPGASYASTKEYSQDQSELGGVQDNEKFDDDVVPDSIPSNFGSAFAQVPRASYASTLEYSQDQSELAEVFQSGSSMSKASALEPVREPLTVVQQINEMYHCRRRSDEVNHLKTIEIVSTLMQETEILSIKNKDLKQQVKLLKEENNHLRMSAEGVLEEENKHLVEEVNQLHQNMKHTVERMYYYQGRCEKYELLQTEQVGQGTGKR